MVQGRCEETVETLVMTGVSAIDRSIKQASHRRLPPPFFFLWDVRGFGIFNRFLLPLAQRPRDLRPKETKCSQ